MKRTISSKGIFAAIAALLLALALWAGVTPPVSVSHADSARSDYTVTKYDMEMEVSENLVVSVKETITAAFRSGNGWENSLHGIIRDLPLGGGVRYRKLSATCDNPDFSPKIHTDDSNYLSYYLRGQGTVYGQTRTYVISYEMVLPAVHGDVFSLNAIGYGWQYELQDVTVRVTVPQGVTLKAVFSGEHGTKYNRYTDGGVQNGNVITVKAERLPRSVSDGEINAAGITLDMNYQKGALSSSFDFSALWAVLIGVVLVALAALAKAFLFRQPTLIKTVDFKPPYGMDPLRMGKLIDNSIDSEDIGSLVFWLAAEGYLTIDMSGSEDDPLLIKTQKPIGDLPAHCKLFYEGLFGNRESVRASDLGNSFYRTAEAVKAGVSAEKVRFYETKSNVFFALFAVLSVLFLGGFAFLYALAFVGSGYFFWVNFVTCVVGFFAGAVGTNVAAQRYHKWKKGKKALSIGAGIAVGLIVSLAGMLFPCAAFTRVTTFLLSACAVAVGCVAGIFQRRTPEYNEKLGKILGFKQFIEFTERDKIEFMLKENPELYYEILPYAQVLGVTDVWTDKFSGLNVKAPSYMRNSSADFVFDYFMWRTMFRTMNASLVRNMVSRPSSKGGGGKFGSGGFGGGFGGGGFGGGGGRSC